LETSFVSACVTERQDAASVYRRDASLAWWNGQSGHHELFISAEVLGELSHHGHQRGRDAIAMVEGVPLLPLTEEVRGFAVLLVREKVMPGPMGGDATHVSVATVHGADYLLTWNVRHLANPNKLVHLRTIALRAGRMPPAIVTPDLLWESDDDQA